MGPEVPSRARRALPAPRRSEKEDGCRPSEFLVDINWYSWVCMDMYGYESLFIEIAMIFSVFLQ